MITLTEARRRAALLDTRPWEVRRIERDEEDAAAAARALVAELERTHGDLGHNATIHNTTSEED